MTWRQPAESVVHVLIAQAEFTKRITDFQSFRVTYPDSTSIEKGDGMQIVTRDLRFGELPAIQFRKD